MQIPANKVAKNARLTPKWRPHTISLDKLFLALINSKPNNPTQHCTPLTVEKKVETGR